MKKASTTLLSNLKRMTARSAYQRRAATIVKTAVFEDAIAIAKPAWEELATDRIIRSYTEKFTPVLGADSDYDAEYLVDVFPQKGLLLEDAYDDHVDGTGFRGRCEGRCLFLLADGGLASVSRSGTWTDSLSDGGDAWTATLSLESVSEAIAGFSVEGPLQRLGEALRMIALRGGYRGTRKLAAEIDQLTTPPRDFLAKVKQPPAEGTRKILRREDPFAPLDEYETAIVARSSKQKMTTIYGRRVPIGWWVFSTANQLPGSNELPEMSARLEQALTMFLGRDWLAMEPERVLPDLRYPLRKILKATRFAASADKNQQRLERVRAWDDLCAERSEDD